MLRFISRLDLHGQVPVDPEQLLLRAGKPQMGPHPCPYLLVCERLGYVIDPACVEGLELIFRFGEGADEQDGYVAGGGGLLHPPADLEPVHPGHHDVENGEVQAFFGADGLPRLVAITGDDYIIPPIDQLGLQKAH